MPAALAAAGEKRMGDQRGGRGAGGGVECLRTRMERELAEKKLARYSKRGQRDQENMTVAMVMAKAEINPRIRSSYHDSYTSGNTPTT